MVAARVSVAYTFSLTPILIPSLLLTHISPVLAHGAYLPGIIHSYTLMIIFIIVYLYALYI